MALARRFSDLLYSDILSLLASPVHEISTVVSTNLQASKQVQTKGGGLQPVHWIIWSVLEWPTTFVDRNKGIKNLWSL